MPFFYISGSDFVELFVGVGASRVRDMFKEAKRSAPCLIFIDEMNKSDDVSVRQKGLIMQSTAHAYRHALKRAGIEVGNDNKLTLGDMSKITEQDVKYAFGYGGFLDKVTQKADQVKSLVGSASAMGYGANKISTYAYNTGALFSVYA